MQIAKISSQKDKLGAINIFFVRNIRKKVLTEKSFLLEICRRNGLRRLMVLAQCKKVCYKAYIERKENTPSGDKTDNTGTSGTAKLVL